MARLVFIAIYSLAFITAGFGHWAPTTSKILYIVVSVVWLLLLAMYIHDLIRTTEPLHKYVWKHPAIPMLLIAPLFLLLYWDAVWFVLVIAAYILELRQHSAGNAFTFSFCLIIFVGVLAALAMAELENDVIGSQFHGPGDSLLWAFGSLLRIDTGKTFSPVTQDGKFLAVVIQVSAILAASMFTAKLVGWVMGTSKPGAAAKSEEDDEPDPIADSMRAEIADLRAAIVRLTDSVERGQSSAAASSDVVTGEPEGRTKAAP